MNFTFQSSVSVLFPLGFHIWSPFLSKKLLFKSTYSEDEEAAADQRVFMEMRELVSDVNVLCVLSVTGLAP